MATFEIQSRFFFRSDWIKRGIIQENIWSAKPLARNRREFYFRFIEASNVANFSWNIDSIFTNHFSKIQNAFVNDSQFRARTSLA